MRGTRLIVKLAMLVMVVLLPAEGCGPPVVSLAPPPQGLVADDEEIVQNWTRSAQVYRNFETRAVVHATFYSHRFIESYLGKYEELYKPVAQELADVRDRLVNRKSRQECFFVALMTGNREWNDLALPNSIWRITLETDDGRKVKSSLIREITKQDQLHQHFFPYVDAYRETYLICFSRYPMTEEEGGQGLPRALLEPGIGSFTLALRSPVAKLLLTWKVQKPSS